MNLYVTSAGFESATYGLTHECSIKQFFALCWWFPYLGGRGKVNDFSVPIVPDSSFSGSFVNWCFLSCQFLLLSCIHVLFICLFVCLFVCLLTWLLCVIVCLLSFQVGLTHLLVTVQALLSVLANLDCWCLFVVLSRVVLCLLFYCLSSFFISWCISLFNVFQSRCLYLYRPI